MRPSSRLPLCVLLLALLLSAVDCRAEDRSGVWQYGFSVGYGFSDRASVEVIPFLVHAAWLFPDFIDEPLHRYNVDFTWVPEFWVAGVTNHHDAVEVGLNPIAIDLSYDEGQQFVPFIQGGVGVMYTSLQGGFGLSGPFEFDSYGGAGVRIFLTDTLSLSVSARLRHISNAGIKDPNVGLDTVFFLVGLDSFTHRGESAAP